MRTIPILFLLLLASAPAAAQFGRDHTPVTLFNNVLGCGTCHGHDGEGALGPALRGTALSLRAVLVQVRTPRAAMPPFSPHTASDARLAAVYEWLRGSEEVHAPLPLRVSLPAKLEAWRDERAEGTVAVSPADSAAPAPAPPARYRLLLARRDGTPVAGHRVEVRRGRWGRWGAATTHADGGAPLPPSRDGAAANFRLAPLPPGWYTLVVEARAAEGDALLGIASAPLYIW